MLDKNIQDRINILEPDYATFVKSNFATEAAQQFGTPIGFSVDQTNILSNAIILFLIFFLDFENFVQFITEECEVSEGEAIKIAGAVLSSLPDNFTLLHTTAYQQLTVTTPNTPVTAVTPEADPVYSTTQETLLQEATKPTIQNPTWG